MADENIDAVITGLRPHASETDPASKIATATEAVTDEIAKLLVAALTRNSCANKGKSGCTQYISAKVANPAENSAKFVCRNAGVPRRIKAASD
jgi:hypothetical protein